MSEQTKPPKPPQDIVVTQAPAHVRELLKNIRVTIPIATAFDAIELVMLEAQRNIVLTTTDKADLPAAITAIDHMMKHFRLFKDQGNVDIAKREAEKSNR